MQARFWRASSAMRVEEQSASTLGSLATTRRISSTRSSGVNSPRLTFSELTMTHTISLSKHTAARLMMFRCTRVMGSKLPG